MQTSGVVAGARRSLSPAFASVHVIRPTRWGVLDTASGEVPAGPRVASEAAVVAVRGALQARWRGAVGDGELRRAIRALCDEARRHEMPAERLLVSFKQACGSAADGSGIRPGPDRDELARRAVTMCIEEYYAGPPAR